MRVIVERWVVYQMKMAKTAMTRNAVCTQTEWDAMEVAQPGTHTLIRANIGNEGEAERLARDLQPPPIPPPNTKRAKHSIAQAVPPSISSETLFIAQPLGD